MIWFFFSVIRLILVGFFFATTTVTEMKNSRVIVILVESLLEVKFGFVKQLIREINHYKAM